MPRDISPSQLIIVGAGGHGREVFALASAICAIQPELRILGFVDDGHVAIELIDRLQTKWLGAVDSLIELAAPYVLGIGSSSARRVLQHRLSSLGAQCAEALVHPSSWIGPDVRLAEGAVVFAGVSITTNVQVGRHVHVNRSATIGHDCNIGDYVSIAPMAVISGNVSIADDVELGAGAIILPGIRIGPSAVVGAGAVVTHEVKAGTTVAGVPAREIGHDRSPMEST